MAKILKILGIIILTIVILLGVGIYLVVHTVDPNKLKDQIGSIVYDNTGRHLTIQGNLSWSFFPWVGFKVSNVQLSDPKGFSQQNFVKIGEADISVRVLPLLSGHIEVRNIELNNLQINLIRNVNGDNNWTELNNSTTVEGMKAQPAAENKSLKSNHINFSIASLTVVNSSINFDDQQNKQQYSLQNVYIDGNNVGTQQIFPLTLSFNLSASHFSKPLAISFNGNFNVDSHLNSIAINQIAIKINHFNLEGNLSAKNLNSKPNFQGNMHIADFNLNKFLTLFKIILPKMKEATALQNFSTDIAFNGNDNSLSIKPLNIGLDNTKINGNIEINNFSAPKINFKLAADKLNIDNYLPKKVKIKSETSTRNISPAQNTTTSDSDTDINLPIKMLRKLKAKGIITINQLIASALHFNNTKITINATNGLLNLNPIDTNLYEGKATANLSLNVKTSIPQYQASMTLQKVQAEPLLNDLLNKDFISGTAQFSANLNTTGNTINTLIRNLNGNSQFSFNNGMLIGINVEYDLARTKALLNKKPPPAAPKNNNTSFGKITGTININSGIANNNDLLIDNKAFTGKGQGIANLNTKILDYKIAIIPNQISELKAYKIPIKINGELTSPSIQLDTENILQQLLAKKQAQAKQHLHQQVQKLVKNENLNKALGNLFGH